MVPPRSGVDTDRGPARRGHRCQPSLLRLPPEPELGLQQHFFRGLASPARRRELDDMERPRRAPAREERRSRTPLLRCPTSRALVVAKRQSGGVGIAARQPVPVSPLGSQTRLSHVDQLRNILRRRNDSRRSWAWSTIGDGYPPGGPPSSVQGSWIDFSSTWRSSGTYLRT